MYLKRLDIQGFKSFPEKVHLEFDKDITLHQDKELFFDYESMRYFESTFEDVKRAEYLLNQI